jgi:hypothetical protein
MGHRLTLRLLPLALPAMLILAWLWANGAFTQTSVAFSEELRHPNGLRTAVPGGYKLEARTPDGFRFGLVKPQRLIDWIEVRRAVSRPVLAPSGLEVLTRRETYMIEDMGGGSGGTEYQLTAWTETPGGWVLVVAVQQSEFMTPRFDAGWAVLERSVLETL